MNGDLLGTVLWPFKWVVEAILVSCHTLLTVLGLPAAGGLTWILSVLGLVIIVRLLLTPLFTRQIASQRKTAEIAPQLKGIQARHKGKTDRRSREALSRETTELYRRAGASPFSSCLPVLVQVPILLSLFQVLNAAMRTPGTPGVSFLTPLLSASFGHATLWGAPLRFTLLTPAAPPAVLLIGVGIILVMAASQVVAQVLNTSRVLTPDLPSQPIQGQQKVLLYLLPVIVVASGVTFPLGVMLYWAFSSAWTLGQNYLITRPHPWVRRTRTAEG